MVRKQEPPKSPKLPTYWTVNASVAQKERICNMLDKLGATIIKDAKERHGTTITVTRVEVLLVALHTALELRDPTGLKEKK